MEDLQKHIKNIRINIVKMVYNAQSGHIGGALSAADILATLYFRVMDINKENASGIDRDRFVLSKGHGSALLYATLFEKGIFEGDLLTYRGVNSKLQGHPNMNYVDGVDMSTGSLGQGISAAVGMALANKLAKNDHRIYVLLGDGESDEGIVWEAAMAAAHYKLDNLCVTLDLNGLQIDGFTKDVMDSSSLKEKFEAFNWNVIEVDGHDLDALYEAYNVAKDLKGRPTLVLAKTVKGKGVSFMENKAEWHGVAPNKEQFEKAMLELEAE